MSEVKFATQFNEFKQPEKIDISLYCYKIICKEPGCFQVRYVKAQDKSQTRYCKACARMYRLRSRAERARNKRASKNKSPGVSVETFPADASKL